MPIPAATSHDVLLRTLLEKQVDDFEAWVDVGELVTSLPKVDRHLVDAGQILPRSVYRDIQFLQRHRLLEFRPDNPHVRLTPTGVYAALLFDLDESV